MKNAIAFAGSLNEYYFFLRLRSGFAEEGYTLTILSCKLSLWFISYFHKVPFVLTFNSNNKVANQHVRSTVDVFSGMIDETKAAQFYYGVYECAEKLHARKNISLVLIWNGHSVPSKALSVFAEQYHLETLFFELSNIPEKIFVDPKGVNAQSLVFHQPEILQSYPSDVSDYLEWKIRYVEQKRTERTTPLAVRSRKINNIFFLIDAVGITLFDLPKIGEMNFVKKILQFISRPLPALVFDQYDLQSGKYNFFPMQVSNDSQLIVNSTISQEEAIEWAVQQSKLQQRDLLIKPHPVERNQKMLEFLLDIKTRHGIYIVNMPTFQIVEHAQEVITINSTVGLESLIAGKKVKFLGNSFYPLLSGELLKNYLLGYLIDIDYFSGSSVPRKQVKEILSRRLLR